MTNLARSWILVGVLILAIILANIGTSIGSPALNVIAQLLDYAAAIVILINMFLLRSTMRQRLGFEPDSVCDCLKAWCCNCCSLVQIGREVDVKAPWSSTEQTEGLDLRVSVPGPSGDQSGGQGAAAPPAPSAPPANKAAVA